MGFGVKGQGHNAVITENGFETKICDVLEVISIETE